MRFIDVWSYKCAYFLTKQLGESHEQRRVYYYGFQILIGGIVKAIVFLSLSYITGVLVPVIATLVFFGFIRTVAGGYHMDKFDRCLVTSLVIFIGAGFIVKYAGPQLSTLLLSILTGIVFVLALFVLIKYAPSDTPYKPIVNPVKRKRLKIISIINLFIWLVVNSLLLYNDRKMFATAGFIGVLLALFIVSPAGYAFFDVISGKRSIKFKKNSTI